MPRRFTPIIITAIAAVALFLAGCSQGASGIPGVSSLTLNPNCKYNDSDLCKFVNNFKEVKDYSSKSTTTAKDSKMETLFESSGQDKSHMVTSENGKETYNVIAIGDTTYTKDYSDGKWWKQKQPKQTEPEQKVDIKEEIKKSEESTEDRTTYKKIGKEACGPRQCFKYQVIDPNFPNSIEYIWFDDKDYLLRRDRIEDKDGTVTDSEIAYSANISAPSPTKDAKPDQLILPGGGVTGISEQELKDLQKAAEESQKMMENQPTNPSD